MTRDWAVAVTLVVGGVVSVYAQQAPIFKASRTAVVFDVSVRTGGRPVAGLTAADFELREEGTLQEIVDMEAFTGAVDLSLVMDEAHLRAGGLAETFASTLSGIRARLQPEDAVREVWFDRGVRASPVPDPLSLVPREGAALFDAVTAAAMFPVTDPRRKHVVVAITPGLDRNGALVHDSRLRVLARSGVVLHIVAIADRSRSFYSVGELSSSTGQVVSRQQIGSYDPLLNSLADLTGGRFFPVQGGNSIVDAVVRAIDDFRARYWLRYLPNPADAKGFRRVSVTVVRSGRHDVRARTGYWRD